MEEWRDVVGFEGYYLVSNTGKVLGKKGLLTPYLAGKVKKGNGYYMVDLYKDSVRKKMYVHTIVATAFVLNPNGLKEINHKNLDKLDNADSNLEWSTRVHNVNHSRGLLGLNGMSNKQYRKKLTPDKVTEIRELIKGGMKQKDVASLFMVSSSMVSMIKNNKFWVEYR